MRQHKRSRRLREALLDLCAERGYKKLKLKHLLERAEMDEADFPAPLRRSRRLLRRRPRRDLRRVLRPRSGGGRRADRLARPHARHRLCAAALPAPDERVARLAAVEVQYAGKRAQELFLETFNRLVKLLDEGSSEADGPDSPGLATAIGVGGVVFARIQEAVAKGELGLGEEEIPELMYAAVFPYLGAEAAEEELRIPADLPILTT